MSTYQVPSKYGNVVCGECHNNFPQVYHECGEPCAQLVSWASSEAAKKCNETARQSLESIRARHAEAEKLRDE